MSPLQTGAPQENRSENAKTCSPAHLPGSPRQGSFPLSAHVKKYKHILLHSPTDKDPNRWDECKKKTPKTEGCSAAYLAPSARICSSGMLAQKKRRFSPQNCQVGARGLPPALGFQRLASQVCRRGVGGLGLDFPLPNEADGSWAVHFQIPREK